MSATIFEGREITLCQELSDTARGHGSVVSSDESGSTPLDLFQFVDVGLEVRVPYSCAVF